MAVIGKFRVEHQGTAAPQFIALPDHSQHEFQHLAGDFIIDPQWTTVDATRREERRPLPGPNLNQADRFAFEMDDAEIRLPALDLRHGDAVLPRLEQRRPLAARQQGLPLAEGAVIPVDPEGIERKVMLPDRGLCW